MHLEMLSMKWRQICLGLNVLNMFIVTLPYLHVGYSAGQFQALQLIVLAAFGVVD